MVIVMAGCQQGRVHGRPVLYGLHRKVLTARVYHCVPSHRGEPEGREMSTTGDATFINFPNRVCSIPP